MFSHTCAGLTRVVHRTVSVQDEAKQAIEAAYHARATATGAQAEAEHEKKRSSELQLRCLQLEQQLASLGGEMLTLQNHTDERSRELIKWQQSAVSPDDRGSIVASLLSLVKGCVLLPTAWMCHQSIRVCPIAHTKHPQMLQYGM